MVREGTVRKRRIRRNGLIRGGGGGGVGWGEELKANITTNLHPLRPFSLLYLQ
jgi:hypothetical protein